MNQELRRRRVAIYARVSTEHKEQLDALENQLDWYKPFLQFHPEWEVVERYIDRGITGTSATKRPQFMQMIRDAKKHKFDLILTREVSRFARNTVDTLQYTRELKAIGVEVFFINDNIKTFDGDGELRLTIMATLAQDESRKTSVRVKSGLQTSMENGVIFGNGNLLGYDRVETIVGANQKQVDYLVNPEQAKTVRMIYDWYLAGHGLQWIKDELERQGRKTATGLSRWSCTVISHVLKNAFYCGVLVYHKYYVPDFLEQKAVKNYGEIEQTVVQGKHETIVTKEEYERVQIIMESKRSAMKNLNVGPNRTKGKRPNTTVWGRLLICECGHRFNRRKWDRSDRLSKVGYQCYSTMQTGSYSSRLKRGLPVDGICRSPMIPEWRLQMMANAIFRNYLMDKDKVLALANAMLEAHIGDTEGDTVDQTADREQLERELHQAQQKLDRLIELRTDGDISREAFQSKAEPLHEQIRSLRDEIDALSLSEPEREEPVENYAEKLTVLQYALEQYTNWDDKDVPPCVIEAFVEKIVVHPDSFDWYLRFDGDPNDPLRCIIKGKRKTTTTVSVTGGVHYPSIHKAVTGCDQRSEISNQPKQNSAGFPAEFLRVREVRVLCAAGRAVRSKKVFFKKVLTLT